MNNSLTLDNSGNTLTLEKIDNSVVNDIIICILIISTILIIIFMIYEICFAFKRQNSTPKYFYYHI